MSRCSLKISLCFVLATLSLACGSGDNHGSAGSSAGGRAIGAGGTSGQGGSAATTGDIATGGRTATGGILASGGNASTGGATGVGGGPGTGGRAETGGSPGTGGSQATGGRMGSGGAGTGGSQGTGGRTAGTGGSEATGGQTASGGAGTGGSQGTGGRADTGSGGSPGTGGRTGTGGTATGGSPATGGRSGTGGADGTSTGGSTGGNPPTATMRVFYLRPSDVAFDQKYPDGIGKVMVDAQAFYQQQLGKTFKLNDPIVETLVGEHERTWYENTPNGGDKYWWSATNAQQEIARRLSLSIPDKRWMVVSEVSAEGTGAGGGASGGWVLLCGHDADGGAGYPADKARWVGGMVHELGHAFGLPDSTSTDGTCMSGSFYSFPNCTFTQSQKDQMLNGAWGTGKFLF